MSAPTPNVAPTGAPAVMPATLPPGFDPAADVSRTVYRHFDRVRKTAYNAHRGQPFGTLPPTAGQAAAPAPTARPQASSSTVTAQGITTADLLGAVLAKNGKVGIGLSAAVEDRVDGSFRIPVPSNIANAQSACDLLRVAHWAYEKGVATCPGSKEEKELFGLRNWLAYVYGLVALEDKQIIGTSYDDLRLNRWDSEVTVYQDTVGSLGVDFPPADTVNYVAKVSDATGMIAAPPALISDLMTYCFASKMSWFQIGHHLGSSDKNGVYQGYLQKVVKTKPLTVGNRKLDFSDEGDRNLVYRLCHPMSTKAACKLVYPKFAADIQDIIQVPVSATFGDIDCGTDVTIRGNPAPAGFAKVYDIVAAVKTFASHPLWPALPGMNHIIDIYDLYIKVKAEPFGYGKACFYISKDPQSEVFDVSPYSTLLASLAVMVNVFRKNSSLSRAACFTGDFTALEGYLDEWYQTCTSFQKAAATHSSLSQVQIDALVAQSGVTKTGALTADLRDAIKGIQAQFDENKYVQLCAALNP